MENIPVSIKVGGKEYMTTRATLMSLPNTLLAEITDPRVPFHKALEDADEPFQVDAAAAHLPCYDIRRDGRKHGFDSEEDVRQDAQHARNSRSKYVFLSEDNQRNEQSSRTGPVFLSSFGVENIFSDDSDTTSNTSRRRDRVKGHSAPHTPENPFKTTNGHKGVDFQGATHSGPHAKRNAIFVDRNPVLMPYILDAYRLGQLHLPANVCSLSIREELSFWKIPEDIISECCWKNFHEGLKSMTIVNTISRSLYSKFEDPSERSRLSWLGKIWLTMEMPSYNLAAKIWCLTYYACILLSLVVFMLLTVKDFYEIRPEFMPVYHQMLADNKHISYMDFFPFLKSVEAVLNMEHALRVFFTLEFLIRLVTCPEKKEYLKNTHNVVDMIIIALMWTRWTLDYLFMTNANHLDKSKNYILMVFNSLMGVRVLSVFHVTKHSPPLKVMFLSIRASIPELFMLVMILCSAVLIFGTTMFVAESVSTEDVKDQKFENIPLAMWWAVVTMTTVGYGDFFPVHPAGYAVGVACAISGILLFAMPIAIVSANFSNHYDNITSQAQGVRRKNLMIKLGRLASRYELQNKKNGDEPSARTLRDQKINCSYTSSSKGDGIYNAYHHPTLPHYSEFSEIGENHIQNSRNNHIRLTRPFMNNDASAQQRSAGGESKRKHTRNAGEVRVLSLNAEQLRRPHEVWS